MAATTALTPRRAAFARLAPLALAAALAAAAAATCLADSRGGKNPRTVRDEARAARKGWIVLQCGSDWSPAGERLAAMLKSTEFRKMLGPKYITAVKDVPDEPPAARAKRLAFDRENIRASVPGLSSAKMPALFIGSPRGDLFYTIENAPADLTPYALSERIAKADAVREAAEKEFLAPAMVKHGAEAAELCGRFFEALERQAGGVARLKLECSYARAWAKLEKSDPSDATGWRRRFAMGDGNAIVAKATEFARKPDVDAGERFIAAENAKPSAHLTVVQRQALLMAKFALHREDEYKKDEHVALLRKIAGMGYDTIWGTAAVGWLNRLGEPPVAIPFGWRAKDMSHPSFTVKVHYGVKEAFSQRGVYDITFSRDSGAGEFKIGKISLLEDGRTLATAEKPHLSSDGLATTFSLRFNPEYGDMATHLSVEGTADRDGADCNVSIRVHRRVLRPRGAARRAGSGTGGGE